MAEKVRKKKGKPRSEKTGTPKPSPTAKTRLAAGPEEPFPEGFDPKTLIPDAESEESGKTDRIDMIKASHALLRQFTAKELKTLTNLKRNTSPKAWTLREDLIVLTLAMSNREIAELLKVRNKEAVKKRLQLLKSKGLAKRVPDAKPKKK